jgi:hypothetical protein
VLAWAVLCEGGAVGRRRALPRLGSTEIGLLITSLTLVDIVLASPVSQLLCNGRAAKDVAEDIGSRETIGTRGRTEDSLVLMNGTRVRGQIGVDGHDGRGSHIGMPGLLPEQ